MTQKKCFKGGDTKPLIEFYKHREMADGHLNKCKDCTKADVSRHREENIERITEYELKRARDPERQAKQRMYNKVCRERHPDRKAARTILGNAIGRGKIDRPSVCSEWGEPGYIEAHHHDYTKPLDVVWLCFRCHLSAHGKVAYVSSRFNTGGAK